MGITQVINNQLIKGYFIILTLLFVIISLLLPYDSYGLMTILYALLGPVLFFVLNWRLTFDFSAYVESNYPELMKKHSVTWGVMKGEKLNSLSVYQNKKDFESMNDSNLMAYFEKGLLLLKMTFFSFVLTPTIGIIVMEVRI